MEDLNAQLALLLGGNAAFVESSPVSQSIDLDPLSFLNTQMSPDGVFSSPFSEQTSPFMGASPLESMTIPVEGLSLEALLTPGLSTNSLAPSPDFPYTSSHSPATGMFDILPTEPFARSGSPSLQLAQTLLGNAMSGILQDEAMARNNALAALTAQMLANAAQSALPPPPPVTPSPAADLSFATMLLNMVRDKKSTESIINFPLPAVAPLPPPPKSEPPVEIAPPPAIDPITGLPIKVKKKVGRKKKIRPTDPEIIAAELARKRMKNTEAARRSRMKRMQKVDSLEERLKMLEEERDGFEAKIMELEEIKARLEARVEELEANMSDAE